MGTHVSYVIYNVFYSVSYYISYGSYTSPTENTGADANASECF